MSTVASPVTRRVPTYCYQCVAGPDLLTVKVEDGVATEVEPNFCAAAVHPGGGKVCVKAFGLIQKTYNPNRVLTPMKRSNPKKGRDEDPGFVPISWDEAFELIAGKLNAIRAAGLTDASGYPRVAASFGGGGTPQFYMGTFPAFLSAWGPVDMGFGSGQGVKCDHSEHLYGEFWHRAFIVAADTPTTRLPDLVRLQHRSLGRRGRRLAPCQRARARHEARAGRAAPVGHRRVLGAMGADQAEDRPGVPVRADPRDAARDAARAARPAVPQAAHRVALPGRAARLLPARSRHAQAAGVGHDQRPRGAARHAGHHRGARGLACRSMRSRSAPTTRCWPTACSTARPASTSWSRTCAAIRPSGRRACATCRPRRCARSRTNTSSTRASARRSRSKARPCPIGRWP